ncbi:hypothetical protein EXIGLDRAFT_642316 [Exidia glandulosa HHB12029]|uniref:Membrane-associated proteins in eicosanoid and glutathione metabolism n=1 Tax=Exidia glandulosa HHB12029 TaxID=1314781 RepID=A0A165L5R9_EXIGL|nr:hypothetical protein EXIGLDRAFT_642316 [Exidia glandulosa HHB12029]
MPATTLDLLDVPLSLFSIPVVWMVGFAPTRLRVKMFRDTIGWNNLEPRTNLERLEKDPKVDKAFLLRLVRLEGAHQNGLEALPLWASAVIAGNMVGMNNRTLNIYSALFVGGRVLFNYIYVAQKTKAHSYVRCVVWATTTGISLYMLVQSALIRLRSV